MPIRRDPIYISYDVWRALWLIAKSKDRQVPPAATPDEIADDILRQAIKEQHPQLFEHQKKIEKLDKELLENLAWKDKTS